MQQISSILEQFPHKRVAVIGDIMLDRYIYGKVDRISPEAPIPIVAWNETMIVPGGAGNAAANIVALGGQCSLFGVVGEDSEAEELIAVLQGFGITTDGLIHDNRPTTEKTRVLGNHQQIVRIDHEKTHPLSEEKTRELIAALETAAPECDALLICDYAKGVVSQVLMDAARRIGQERNIPVLADVRPEHKTYYHDLTFITPNKKETSGMVGVPVRSLDDAKTHGLALAKELKTNVLLTMSEDGMLIIDHATENMTHLPTKAQEVVDVSGAGDTVIATTTLCLASGADHLTAATIANHAASVVVGKLGTATLSVDELKATF